MFGKHYDHCIPRHTKRTLLIFLNWFEDTCKLSRPKYDCINFKQHDLTEHLKPTLLTKTTELAPTAAPKAPNIGRGLTGWGVGMEALGFPVKNKQEAG